VTVRFCPLCRFTVYWTGEGFPGYVAVAIGAFADPTFPAPTIPVWEACRHPRMILPYDTPLHDVRHLQCVLPVGIRLRDRLPGAQHHHVSMYGELRQGVR
jgi:hypothetical protein